MAQTEDSRPCKRTPVQCRNRMREITNGADDESADQHGEEQDLASRSRKAKADSRAIAPLPRHSLVSIPPSSRRPSRPAPRASVVLRRSPCVMPRKCMRKPSITGVRLPNSSRLGPTARTASIARAHGMRLYGVHDFWRLFR